MDTIIFIVLLVTAVMIFRGAGRATTIALWALGLVLALVLFKIHATSSLDLSF